MKKLLTLLLAVVLVLAACGRPSGDSSSSSNDGGESGDTYTLRIAYLVSEDQSSHIGAEQFKEQVEAESDGRIKVELYPNGSLFPSDREAIEAVQLGNVEGTIPAVAALSSFNKKFMVFDLPFLFDTYDEVYSALDGELGQELLAELEENNMKGLVFGANGFRHMMNNKGPIEKPEDLKGLKIRTMESPVQTDSFKAWGANASPFAFGELYTAIQQGTYDGMENPISLIYTHKFYEVQDYLTLSGHFYAPTALLLNNDFYNSLPEDLQEIVDQAAIDFRTEQRKLAEQQDAEWVKELEEFGVQINELTDEQKAEFREAAQEVYDKYASEIGEDVIEKALEYSESN